MAGKEVAETAEKVSRFKWLKPNGGLMKSLPFIGAAAAAVVAAPFVINSFRNNRRFDENSEAIMPKSLSDPLPPVMHYAAPEPPISMANPIEGEQVAKMKMRRAGGNALDVTSPSITPPGSNISVIDGKPVMELDAKHVNNLHKEAAKLGAEGRTGPG